MTYAYDCGGYGCGHQPCICDPIATPHRADIAAALDRESRDRAGLTPIAAPSSFTCPRCGRTSHHPMDALNRYCGACHVFDPEPDEKSHG
jgi:hypothetical protein